MTRDEVARELRRLPPEEAAALLRQLLDGRDGLDAETQTWRAAVTALLTEYRRAWEDLAKR